MTRPHEKSEELAPSIFQKISRRRGLVLVTLAAAGVLGVFHFFKLPAMYESSAKLLVRHAGNEARSGSGEQGPLSDADILANLLTDPKTIAAASTNPELKSLPSVRAADDPAEFIRKGLAARPYAASPDFVLATYRGPHAADCRRILEIVLASRPEFVKEPGAAARTEISGVLEEMDRAKRNIRQEEEKLRAFETTAPASWTGAESEKQERKTISQLEESLAAAERQRADVQADKEAIEAALAEGDRARAMELVKQIADARLEAPPPAPDVAPPAPKPGQAASPGSIEALQADKARLLVTFGPAHPEIRKINARIEAARNAGGIETAETRLQAELQILRQTYGEENPKILAVKAQLEALRGGKREVVDGMVRRRPPATPPGPPTTDPVTAAVEKLTSEIDDQADSVASIGKKLAEHRMLAESFADYDYWHKQAAADVQKRRDQYDTLVANLSSTVSRAYVSGQEVLLVTTAGAAQLVEPKLTHVLGAWLAIGLVAGVALALAAEMASRGLRQPSSSTLAPTSP